MEKLGIEIPELNTDFKKGSYKNMWKCVNELLNHCMYLIVS